MGGAESRRAEWAAWMDATYPGWRTGERGWDRPWRKPQPVAQLDPHKLFELARDGFVSQPGSWQKRQMRRMREGVQVEFVEDRGWVCAEFDGIRFAERPRSQVTCAGRPDARFDLAGELRQAILDRPAVTLAFAAQDALEREDQAAQDGMLGKSVFARWKARRQ